MGRESLREGKRGRGGQGGRERERRVETYADESGSGDLRSVKAPAI